MSFIDAFKELKVSKMSGKFLNKFETKMQAILNSERQE